MSRFFEKILVFLGLAEIEEVDTIHDESSETYETNRMEKKGKVVSLHSAKNVKVVILKPTEFSEVEGIADHLKQKRPVIINLENAERDIARRVLDFISGTTYAFSGNMQKVSEEIFIFTPENYELSADFSELIDEGVIHTNKFKK